MAVSVTTYNAEASDADLASVTRTLVSQPNVRVTDGERFFGEVHALIEDRARRRWPGESDAEISLFVRVEYPRQAASALDKVKPSVDMIGTNEPLMGRIFLLDRNAAQGWSGDLPFSDPGQIVEWLIKLPFGGNQVILAYRNTMLLIERANGAQGETTRREVIRTKEPAVTADGLFEALDAFHMREVLTPHDCPEGLWRPEHAASYHPGPNPEAALQSRLKTFLTGWFHGYLRIEREISTEIGRIDIALLMPPPAVAPDRGLSYWAIVELKVVKSFRYSKSGKDPVKVFPIQNARDIAKGIQQAYAFKKNRGCPHAVLEIYDMRSDKSVDPRQHAEVKKVIPACTPLPTIRLIPLYGSAQQARDAGANPPASL